MPAALEWAILSMYEMILCATDSCHLRMPLAKDSTSPFSLLAAFSGPFFPTLGVTLAPAAIFEDQSDFSAAFPQGYEEVSQKFTSIRRVRGDNYCALRATLFQAMSLPLELPPWLQDPELTLVR